VFELNQGGHHDHLVCMQCGRVEEFYRRGHREASGQVAKPARLPAPRAFARALRGLSKKDCPYRQG